MAQLDNPAGRIEAVLERAKKYTSERGSARDGWRQAFDVGDASQLPARIAHFIMQVQLTKELVAALPDYEDPEHLSTYFGNLDQIIDALLSVGALNMSQFAPWITPELLFSLGACSRALRRHDGQEPTLDVGEVENILDTIRQVQEELTQSALPQHVKLLLIRRVREVEEAVLAIKIAGYPVVESTLDALLGSVAWRTDPAEQNKVATWVKRIWSAIFTASHDTAQIAGYTQKVVESYKTITGQ